MNTLVIIFLQLTFFIWCKNTERNISKVFSLIPLSLPCQVYFQPRCTPTEPTRSFLVTTPPLHFFSWLLSRFQKFQNQDRKSSWYVHYAGPTQSLQSATTTVFSALQVYYLFGLSTECRLYCPKKLKIWKGSPNQGRGYFAIPSLFQNCPKQNLSRNNFVKKFKASLNLELVRAC